MEYPGTTAGGVRSLSVWTQSSSGCGRQGKHTAGAYNADVLVASLKALTTLIDDGQMLCSLQLEYLTFSQHVTCSCPPGLLTGLLGVHEAVQVAELVIAPARALSARLRFRRLDGGIVLAHAAWYRSRTAAVQCWLHSWPSVRHWKKREAARTITVHVTTSRCLSDEHMTRTTVPSSTLRHLQ